MRVNVYSIRDLKGKGYSEPFLAHTHGEAERSFSELVKDPKTLVSKYPEDYSLYQIGTYDHSTGSIQPLEMPQHLTEGISVKKLMSAQQ